MKSHVCLVKKGLGPSTDGTLKLPSPYDEICHCQSVVDDLIACSAHNWNKEALDTLLQRVDHCGKYFIKITI